MIIQDIPRIRAFYADALRATCHLHEGKIGKLDTSGHIALATAAADALGVICDPDPHIAAQAGNITGATLIPHTFGGLVELQLGETPGSITWGTLLKLKTDGTVAAATGAAGEHIVAKAMQQVGSQQAGQLIHAAMIAPYTVKS